MADFEKFGFYIINAEYLKYLHQNDSEVYYNQTNHTLKKPFIGIVVGLGEYKYFIPMTSAKEKHIKWKNISETHFLLYELVDKECNIANQIYKNFSEKKKMHLLSVLDIKKMVPVPEGAYEFIDFKQFEDIRYRKLFEKEYDFCLQIQEKILTKAEKLYDNQISSGVVRKMHCDFKRLEQVSEKWKANNK